MATHCFIPLLGKMIRVTELNNCGIVFAGAQQVTTDGFTSLELSSEVEEGAEIIVRKASGALCVNEKRANSFKRFTVNMEFCAVNPSLLAITTNAEEYSDGTDVIGFTVPEGEIEKWFALEMWTGLTGVVCDPGAEEPSGYILLPYVVAGVLGDVAVNGEDAITFSMSDAYTKGGNGWGEGPYFVYDTGGVAVNEQQTVTITGSPTGGTYNLGFGGQLASGIPWNATSTDVQNRLRQLSTIGPTGVNVVGGPHPGTPMTVVFTGPLAGRNVESLVQGSLLTGGSSPAVVIATSIPGTSAAGPLPEPIDPFDHLLMIETNIAPPPDVCDPQTVIL